MPQVSNSDHTKSILHRPSFYPYTSRFIYLKSLNVFYYSTGSCKFEYDFCKWQSNGGWTQTDETDSDIPVRDGQSKQCHLTARAQVYSQFEVNQRLLLTFGTRTHHLWNSTPNLCRVNDKKCHDINDGPTTQTLRVLYPKYKI
jgi:hypothetical protein